MRALRWTRLLTLSCLLVCVIGCGDTKIIFTTPDTILRTGPDVEGTVYVLDAETKEWVLVEEPVRIPEGMYIISPPPKE